MKKLLCIKLTLLLLAAMTNVNMINAQSLVAPEFFTQGPPPNEYCGSIISIQYINNNEGASTEIYRSLSSDGGYQLVHTGTGGYGVYDDDVAPHTTYYYKLRAIKDGQVSPYSNVHQETSQSDFYSPGLTLSVLPDNTVKIEVKDRSFQDYSYEVIGVESETLQVTIDQYIDAQADSGQTYTLIDAAVLPGKTYIYDVHAVLICREQRYTVAQASITVPAQSLVAPKFFTQGPPPQEFCESIITIQYENPNQGASTELYRSLTREGGYQLIPTGGSYGFYDDDVAPHTTYYYKLRAVKDGQVSAFSDVYTETSQSDFYNPVLTLSLLPDNSVKVEVTDRSFQDYSYNVIGVESETLQVTFEQGINAQADSGQTYTFIDANVLPGKTYIYDVNAVLNCKAGPEERYTVAQDSITIPAVTLAPPTFDNEPPYSWDNCASIIDFGVYNPNQGSSTQVYRSLSADNGFELIYTFAPGPNGYSGGHYRDDVKSSTTYYYKLRAIKDGQVSAFSPVEHVKSLGDFYNPVFTATVLENKTVELKLQDRSYLDYNYDIYSVEKGTGDSRFYGSAGTPLDSGTTYTLIDTTGVPGGTYIYYVEADLYCDGTPSISNVAIDTAYIPSGAALAVPQFDLSSPPSNPPCGNEIAFSYGNPNPGARTEIYRSQYPFEDGSGFGLLYTAPPGEFSFLDNIHVRPRTTYYYKLRAVSDDAVSEFSEVQSFTSGPAFYYPVLTATVLPDRTVEIALQGRTALTDHYTVYSVDEETNEIIFYRGIKADSGQTAKLIDPTVIPSKTYIYFADATLFCEGWPTKEKVASDTVTIPDGPAVTSFTLVNAFTDQDVRTLTHSDHFFAREKYTIRANATSKTESVVFYLNGQFHHIENEAPYSLFWDNKGNYNPGNLAPGTYTLSATAYGGNNAQGAKGNTLVVTFNVFSDSRQASGAKASGADVNIFPNPVVRQSVLEVSGSPHQLVRVDVIDQNGNSTMIYQGKLDDTGGLKKELQFDQFKKGTYVLSVKFADETLSQRFIVE